MGGQTGFGPVPVGDDGTVAFHADWEARIYALAAVLRQRPVPEERDDLAGVAAHVPRYPRVMIGVPRPGKDAVADGVAHARPFSATSVSSAPSHRS